MSEIHHISTQLLWDEQKTWHCGTCSHYLFKKQDSPVRISWYTVENKRAVHSGKEVSEEKEGFKLQLGL